MSSDLGPQSNPYPGLRPFRAEDTHLFFGRDQQRSELLSRLRRSRFLAIVGTSGSGKSSLVRAGLLPGLYGGFMAGGGTRWRIADTRPGGDPIGRLAAALDQPGVLQETSAGADKLSFTEATLRRSAMGLIEAVQEARLPAGEKLLVLVDQFEELFRFIDTVHSADAIRDASDFVKLLLEAARQSDLPIYVVLTMRSDFLGDCARFRDLPEAINDGQYLVPRLTRAQNREAIVGPAAVHGVTLTPTLLNRLLNDVGDDPDSLPILQHALMRTWDRWKAEHPEDDILDLEHYESLGGMAHALSRHAESVLKDLSSGYNAAEADKRQQIAESLFKCLTEQSESNQQVRRLATVETIAEVGNASIDEVVSVIEEFRRPGNSFLMPPSSDELLPHTYIDISHESLIRHWKTLGRWVREEAGSASDYKRLARTAVLYPEKEDLLEGRRLRASLEWRGRQQPTAAWAKRYDPAYEKAMDFLAESEARMHAAEKEKVRRKRVRNTVLAGAGAVVLLFVLQFLLDNARVIVENERLLRQQRAANALLKRADKLLTEVYALWLRQAPADGSSNYDKATVRAKLEELSTHNIKTNHEKLAHHRLLAEELGATFNSDAPRPNPRDSDEELYDILSEAVPEKKRAKFEQKRATLDNVRAKVAEAHVERLTQRSRSSTFDWLITPEQRGKLQTFWEEWSDYALFVVIVLALPIWRWIGLWRRRVAKSDTRPNPIWRTFAGATDLVVASLLGLSASAIVSFAIQIILTVRGDSAFLSVDDAEAVGYLAGGAIALVYILIRDGIEFRYRRSIGKILFGLRPVTLSGAPVSLKVSAKRNCIWICVVVALIAMNVAVDLSGSDDEEAWLGFSVLVITVGPFVWFILAWVKSRRTLGDRFARTQVVDIWSQKAAASSGVPVATREIPAVPVSTALGKATAF
jgi:uncharacterized RDD family membrane protein YckC